MKLIHSYGTCDPSRVIKKLPIFFAWVSFIYVLCVEKILLPQLRTMDTNFSNFKDSCCSEILSTALSSSKKRHYLNQFFLKKYLALLIFHLISWCKNFVETHSFGQFARTSMETVRFHKISEPEN